MTGADAGGAKPDTPEDPESGHLPTGSTGYSPERGGPSAPSPGPRFRAEDEPSPPAARPPGPRFRAGDRPLQPAAPPPGPRFQAEYPAPVLPGAPSPGPRFRQDDVAPVPGAQSRPSPPGAAPPGPSFAEANRAAEETWWARPPGREPLGGGPPGPPRSQQGRPPGPAMSFGGGRGPGLGPSPDLRESWFRRVVRRLGRRPASGE
jgi:hypothetical protein